MTNKGFTVAKRTQMSGELSHPDAATSLNLKWSGKPDLEKTIILAEKLHYSWHTLRFQIMV